MRIPWCDQILIHFAMLLIYSQNLIRLILKEWSLKFTELQLNKANSTDTEAAVLDFHLSISNGFVYLIFMTNAMLLILTLLISRFFGWWRSSCLPLMVFTFLSFFGLQECLVIWLTSMLVTKLSLPNFSNRDIGVINLGKLFLSFIADTTNWSLNTRLKHFCYKLFRNLNFTVT